MWVCQAIYKAFYEARMAAIVAGFVALTPFVQVYSEEPYEAPFLTDSAHILLNRGTAFLAHNGSTSLETKTIRPKAVYERVVTAYSSTPEETDSTPFITASGNYVRFGTVAANWLPIGTAVRIPEYFGDQVFIVEDRMNRKHPTKLDIWFPSKEEAVQFGTRTTRIEVL